MDLVGRASTPAVNGVLEEPQGLRRSLRKQTKSARKATLKKVVSPYFVGKPGAGKSGKRSVAISAKTEAQQQCSEDNEGKSKAVVSQSLQVDNYRLLPADFYACDALDLAPRLLGKLLRHDDVILQITEVEAYRTGDTACHARFGRTARTEAMFRAGGHAYVFLCYGINVMLNVVADKDGLGAAVLIRACSPVTGLATILQRRKQDTVKPVLLTGPGKVGQALGLTVDWSCHPLFLPGGLEILDGPAPEAILAGPRVGIDYASPEDVAAPWRFAVAGTPWVSAPRATLLPIPWPSANV
ncbi:hypothetical protein M758_6G074000 [Ceratodon purpureus]|nr:hypothetical protein M758_6G074000 [Ceratodon purpureus]